MLAGFGDDDLIAREDVDIVGLAELLAREAPEDLWPGDGGGKEALHGAVASAIATPAGDAGHRHAAGHREERTGNPAHLAYRGRGQTGLETMEQC